MVLTGFLLLHGPDGLLAVVDVPGASIHPGETDEPGRRMIAEFLQELVAELSVDHLLHVGAVAEHEGEIEHVEFGNHRSHRSDADARDRQGADLSLFDHLLLAAELHRRIHLDAEAPLRGLLELLAHVHDGLDRRVAERVHVARLENHLLLAWAPEPSIATPRPSAPKSDRISLRLIRCLHCLPTVLVRFGAIVRAQGAPVPERLAPARFRVKSSQQPWGAVIHIPARRRELSYKAARLQGRWWRSV
jgi:hypothetical protein